MKILGLVCLILTMPHLGFAQSKLSPLHFFDAIPGLPTTSSKPALNPLALNTSPLFEKFGTANLNGILNLQDLELAGTPEEKSWQIQRLIEYRAGLRQGSDAMSGSLEEDLNWAAQIGFPYPDRQKLIDLSKKLAEKDSTEMIRTALSLEAPLRTALLDGVIGSTDDFSYVLSFLAQNPNLFSPVRRSQLILNAVANLPIDELSTQDVENFKSLSRSMDYGDRSVVCRSAGFFANAMSADNVPSASVQQLEFYKVFSKVLLEMQKKKLSCEDYMGGKTPEEVLVQAEEMGIFPRGTAVRNGFGSASETDPLLKGCQIDKNYRNEVLLEISEYKSLKIGQGRLFGLNSKGQCSLQIIGEKTAKGLKARIILFNARGEKLIYFDQTFSNTQQIALAALENRAPPVNQKMTPSSTGKAFSKDTKSAR